jgi:hypothetical protein
MLLLNPFLFKLISFKIVLYLTLIYTINYHIITDRYQVYTIYICSINIQYCIESTYLYLVMLNISPCVT